MAGGGSASISSRHTCGLSKVVVFSTQGGKDGDGRRYPRAGLWRVSTLLKEWITYCVQPSKPPCDVHNNSLFLFSCSVMSDTLRPYGLQQTRFPCPSPSPRVWSNSCPLSRWCHPTVCHPLFLLPSIFPSIRVFSSESAFRIRWPKYSSFSFRISPSNEYSGWISFRIDWFHLLSVKGTLKSLLQHHNSKASVLQCSVFFMVQLSHLYMTTGKTIALTVNRPLLTK